MIVENQFSRVGELMWRQKKIGCPAKKRSSDERKRALRELEFVGERFGHHGFCVVTSAKKKDAALRSELRPPTPNQTSQRNAIAEPFSVFERRSSRG